MNRYFFISYAGIFKNSNSYLGCCVNITDGSYFNIPKFREDMKNEIKCEQVIVVNIIELTESDYNDMYKKC